MSNALRDDHQAPFPSIRGVHKTHERPRTGSRLRASRASYLADDFGLVCHACSTVTIFSADASHPLACSRCGNGLRAPLAG